jgi:voltage-gated potassium channel
MGKIKKRIFEILEVAKEGDHASKVFDVFITSLIFLNVIAVILGTVNTIAIQHRTFLKFFEIFSIAIFTLEYFLRILSCTMLENFKNPITGRLKFAFTPMALIDLIAILPFYIPKIILLDLRFVRALRLFRVFRLFKIGRYSNALKIFHRAIKSKKEELLITLFTGGILLVIASSLIYFVESKSQPEVFSSIPAAMWWGVITLTTVGYGDVYPITVMGKIIGSFIALLGIGMFALPAGILSSAFADEIQKRKNNIVCPNCGKSLKRDN